MAAGSTSFWCKSKVNSYPVVRLLIPLEYALRHILDKSGISGIWAGSLSQSNRNPEKTPRAGRGAFYLIPLFLGDYRIRRIS